MSALLLEAVRVALRAAEASGGLVDPTVGQHDAARRLRPDVRPTSAAATAGSFRPSLRARRRVAHDRAGRVEPDGPRPARASSSTSAPPRRPSPPTARRRRPPSATGAGVLVEPRRRHRRRRRAAARRLADPDRRRPRRAARRRRARPSRSPRAASRAPGRPCGAGRPRAASFTTSSTRAPAGRRARRGARSPSPRPRASTPTPRAPPRSCSATTRRPGSTSEGFPARLVRRRRRGRLTSAAGRRRPHDLLLAASNAKALWYLTRGSGVVSLLLLTATLVLGVLGATRWRSERWPRFARRRPAPQPDAARDRVHRHPRRDDVADGYAPIGSSTPFVPFVSQYRPIWLGLGALAFDLLLALTAHEPAPYAHRLRTVARRPLARLRGLAARARPRARHRQRLPRINWLAIAYALLRGRGRRRSRRPTRSGQRARRASASPQASRPWRSRRSCSGWYRAGPAQPGWAARAGTPTSILRGTATSASPSPVDVRTTMPSSFDGKLTGRLVPSRGRRRRRRDRDRRQRNRRSGRGRAQAHALGRRARRRRRRDDRQPRLVRASRHRRPVLRPGRRARREPRPGRRHRSAGDTLQAHHLPPDRLRDAAP